MIRGLLTCHNPSCGRLFSPSPRGRSPKFCSGRCRQAFWRTTFPPGVPPSGTQRKPKNRFKTVDTYGLEVEEYLELLRRR